MKIPPFGIVEPMKTFRIIIGVLAFVVIVFFITASLLPPLVNDQDTVLEMLYMVVGIPIFTFNLWAWTAPELIEALFFGMEIEKPQ